VCVCVVGYFDKHVKVGVSLVTRLSSLVVFIVYARSTLRYVTRSARLL